jgi:hypothetical protein
MQTRGELPSPKRPKQSPWQLTSTEHRICPLQLSSCETNWNKSQTLERINKRADHATHPREEIQQVGTQFALTWWPYNWRKPNSLLSFFKLCGRWCKLQAVVCRFPGCHEWYESNRHVKTACPPVPLDPVSVCHMVLSPDIKKSMSLRGPSFSLSCAQHDKLSLLLFVAI